MAKCPVLLNPDEIECVSIRWKDGQRTILEMPDIDNIHFMATHEQMIRLSREGKLRGK